MSWTHIWIPLQHRSDTWNLKGIFSAPSGCSDVHRKVKFYSRSMVKLLHQLKFIYPEKATKFCEISTVDLSYVVPVQWTLKCTIHNSSLRWKLIKAYQISIDTTKELWSSILESRVTCCLKLPDRFVFFHHKGLSIIIILMKLPKNIQHF